MHTLENGLDSSVSGLINGTLQSTVILALSATLASSGPVVQLGLTLMALVGLRELVDRANYWGISYTMGWGFGFILVAPYVLSGWEYYSTGLIIGMYLVIKLIHKF